MLTLNVELIERQNLQSNTEKMASLRVKDGIRMTAIQDIVGLFGGVIL